MSGKGYKVNDPVTTEFDHFTTKPADIAVAKADVDCKRSTNLVGIANGIQAEIDNAYMSKFGAQLTAFAAGWQSQVK